MKGVIREGVKSPACRKRPLMKFSDEDFSCHVSNCVCVCVCVWMGVWTDCVWVEFESDCLCVLMWKCDCIWQCIRLFACKCVCVFVCLQKESEREFVPSTLEGEKNGLMWLPSVNSNGGQNTYSQTNEVQNTL
jgi:hypothetical protein